MLMRSRDWGDSWEVAELPGPINSAVWSVATHPADPMLVFCCTKMGQIFRSTDGGGNWQKIRRELGDLRMIAWEAFPEAGVP